MELRPFFPAVVRPSRPYVLIEGDGELLLAKTGDE
jgi:hypothetical protein